MLLYDGPFMAAEVDATTSAVRRRYVHGPGMDEPLVWYEGSGTSDRRWFHADERGSVIAVSDGSGNLVGTRNRYDEYGVPQGGVLTGRFGYTGQLWLPEPGLYHYRARTYNPALGRFMQTDPIGYGGGMNLYAYVLNDPVNRTDPSGLEDLTQPIVVMGPGWWERLRRHLQQLTRIELRLLQRDFTRGDDASNEGAGNGETEPPFCDEPGADPANCGPVVTGSSILPGSTSLTPTPLSFGTGRRRPNRGRRDSCGGGDQTWPPDNLFGANISGACARHDFCYTTSIDRLICDQRFRRDIVTECQRQAFFLVRPQCIAGAQVYFISVRAGGGRFYTGAGNPD